MKLLPSLNRFFKISTIFCTALLPAIIATPVQAGMLTARFGPPSPGTGGANPLGIPPSVPDMEISYLSSSNWETSISIVPGILYGKRQDFNNFYVTLGGGLFIDANGVGIGPYSAFGWESEGTFRYGIEYKQALGITGSGLISPYAIRFGLGYAF
jgi:hypothetical protein